MAEARIKAGDVFAARRELPDDDAEWNMYAHWRALTRDDGLQLDYLEWLDTLEPAEIIGIMEAVNEQLVANPEASASST